MIFSPLIFLTKTAAQISILQAPLKSLGFKTVDVPCFELHCIPSTPSFKSIIIPKDRWFFTSPNAVQFAKNLDFDFDDKEFAAIGLATRNALIEAGANNQSILTAPKPYTSEAFLEILMPTFTDQNWGIITGKEGRGFLKPALEKRAIKVELFEIYERKLYPINIKEILDHTALTYSAIKNYWVITSEVAFQHLLLETKNGPINLSEFKFLVSSIRLSNLLKSQGLADVHIAKSALNADIIDYFRSLIK